MSNWEFVIVIGCAVIGFLLVSFILELFGTRTSGEPDKGVGAHLSASSKRIGAAFALIFLLLIGYAVAPIDLWDLLTGKHSFGSEPRLGQTADIARSRDGNFSVIAQVNGSRVAFVIDTGASTVTLTQEAARAARLEVASEICTGR